MTTIKGIFGAERIMPIPSAPSNSALVERIKQYIKHFLATAAGASIPIVSIKMMGAPVQSRGHLIVPIVLISTFSSVLVNSKRGAFRTGLLLGTAAACIRDVNFVQESLQESLTRGIVSEAKATSDCVAVVDSSSTAVEVLQTPMATESVSSVTKPVPSSIGMREEIARAITRPPCRPVSRMIARLLTGIDCEVSSSY